MIEDRTLARRLSFGLALALFAPWTFSQAADECAAIFARDNLVAWCIVPFDRSRRTPEQRAEMLAELGFRRFAYDWRAEHLPSFDRELEALKRCRISLAAIWFPAALNDDAKTILDALRRHEIRTQLWITMSDPAPQGGQAEKLAAAIAAIGPIAAEADKLSCEVALYNHGGWFGEPENQLAIIDKLGAANVGIVYNLHHGHDHLDRFVPLLEKMRPRLLALNLNGMDREGDRHGRKILPLGQGQCDLPILRAICASGYRGPIGILGHTMDDARDRLRDNLDGLDWLVDQLRGNAKRPRPTPRTPVGEPSKTPAGASPGHVAAGKSEYRRPPLTVECGVKLISRENYNILVASDTKQSGAHWELFSMAGTGTLTAYLPGMKPDHVHSAMNICDGNWHDVAMLYEPTRVRLLCDGEVVGEEALERTGHAVVAGGLAIGRLVEGGLGCNGAIAYLRLSGTARESVHAGRQAPEADQTTVGLWIFKGTPAGDVQDQSKLNNSAKHATPTKAGTQAPPPSGPNLRPVDGAWVSELIDRSRDDAYMGVKVDSAGCVFVGGREAVYRFQRAGGGFLPRELVCRLPPDSIVMDLEFRGDDLYVLANNALYLLPRGRTEADVAPRRILWGLPLDLHVSFHCLAWGPQGDLYLTHGDPLLNYGDWNRPDHWGHWTLHCGPKGEKLPYTGVGAVLRMRPDGSRVRVVAGGLRGPVGLAFSPRWELFTNDNDHESRADLYAPARLLHVTPRIDFCWPRGWIASKTPRRFDLIEPLTAGLGRGVPCGLTWHDAPSEQHGSLLMARWDRMAVNRYPLLVRGASYAAREDTFLTGRDLVRPVGVAIGPDGRMFVTSLYLGGNVGSPHCHSDLVMVTDGAAELDGEFDDVCRASAEALWRELSHRLWQRRLAAHQELLRRGGAALDTAAARLSRLDSSSTAKWHLPWLAAAAGSADARASLLALAKHQDAELRLQALRVLAEHRELEAPNDLFAAALDDAEPAVQLAALAALFDCDRPPPLNAVARLAAGDDTYLRQTAAKLLARRAAGDDLARLALSDNAAARRAAVLAIGFRLTAPSPDFVPPENLPLTYNSGNAAFTLRFADGDGPVDLRALGRVGSFTTAEWWKSAPHTDVERRLFDLLLRSLDDGDRDVVNQAVYFLSLLNDARSEPLIASARRRLLANEAARFAPRTIEQAWVLGPTGDATFFLEKTSPPDRGSVDLAATYSPRAETIAWRQVSAAGGKFFEAPSKTSPSARVYLCFQAQSTERQAAALEIKGGKSSAAWHNGRPLVIAEHSAPLELQPGSNELLLRLDQPTLAGVKLRYRAAGGVTVSLPHKVDFGLLAERLKEAADGVDRVSAELLSANWTNAVSQGDAQRGRALFGSLGCAKCHGVTLEQPGGGAPNLADVPRRFTTAYVVESVLLPSKQVADPFRGTTLNLADGRTVAGLVVADTDERLELLLPDAKRVTIAKSEIEERAASGVSPMPSGLIKSEQELRDLLAYLFSERPVPP